MSQVCIPADTTPTKGSQGNMITDFSPANPPYIPGMILQCVNEVSTEYLTYSYCSIKSRILMPACVRACDSLSTNGTDAAVFEGGEKRSFYTRHIQGNRITERD